MAVSFNLPTTGRRIMPSETGIPDYISALSKGMDLGYKPRNLENEAYGKELANKINQAKAKYAEQQALADLQSTQTNTSNVAQQIKQKRADMDRMNALRDYLSGGRSIPGSSAKPDNGGWTPGHMTPHGFEGSIAPTNPDDFYANTGEDRQAEQEAVDRIDRANAARQGESFIPSAPSFEQKLKQGVQQNNNTGSSEIERANYLWDNVPSARKDLKAMGFERAKEHVLTGAARDAESMKELADKYGKNSETYKTAEAIRRSKEQRDEDLSAIRHRQLNGLKPGDTEIKDPKTGEVIGFNKQTTDKQKDAAKNTTLFNQLYPLIYKGASIFSGPGATARLEQAARTYKTNPESKKMIDDFLIADKAATTTAVTEAGRFGAGKTNQTFNRFVETLKAEDIHSKLKKWIKEYEIPYEANLKAGIRWQHELNKAEKLANRNIPATMPYYFDPDRQFASQQEQLNAQQDEEPTGDIQSLSDEELMKLAGYK